MAENNHRGWIVCYSAMGTFCLAISAIVYRHSMFLQSVRNDLLTEDAAMSVREARNKVLTKSKYVLVSGIAVRIGVTDMKKHLESGKMVPLIHTAYKNQTGAAASIYGSNAISDMMINRAFRAQYTLVDPKDVSV